jgi:hypothetical protein
MARRTPGVLLVEARKSRYAITCWLRSSVTGRLVTMLTRTRHSTVWLCEGAALSWPARLPDEDGEALKFSGIAGACAIHSGR